jgi:hypothetical protein
MLALDACRPTEPPAGRVDGEGAAMKRVLLGLIWACSLTAAAACGDEVVPEPVRTRWLEVTASDYRLRLEPRFDASVTSYTARADGPGIEVFVDVILSADVEGVEVNGEPSYEAGYRLWRSAESLALIAPTSVRLEILDPSADPAIYEIEITVP